VSQLHSNIGDPPEAQNRHALYLEQVNSSDAEVSCAATVVTSVANIRWLTGFTGSSGVVVVPSTEDGRTVLFTDGRYVDQARREIAKVGARCDVEEARSSSTQMQMIARSLTEVFSSQGLSAQANANARYGLGYEAGEMSVEFFTMLNDAISEVGLTIANHQWLPASKYFAAVRRRKSVAEVECIAKAAAIADSALSHTLEALTYGITERQFRDALDTAMREGGADDVSFPSIVAFGENSALPHHQPSHRQLSVGDSVVVDFGALVDGYHSDMTRSFVAGGNSSMNGQEMLRRYEAVRESCSEGVLLVGPGVATRDIDTRCREILALNGLENELTHGVGHGVGPQIHESPWVNSRSTDVLEVGDVVTVEPGAYRMGLGGVRVEDLLVVTETGYNVLSQSPKDPLCPQ